MTGGGATPAGGLPGSIDVEIGRLNAAVRAILSDLDLSTSTVEKSDDILITLDRTGAGIIGSGGIPRDERGEADVATLVPFCEMIVAGTNIVGRVTMRVRVEDARPVFVWMRTET